MKKSGFYVVALALLTMLAVPFAGCGDDASGNPSTPTDGGDESTPKDSSGGIDVTGASDGATSDTGPAGTAKLGVDSTLHHFGSVTIGDTSPPSTFTVTNTGTVASGAITASLTGAGATSFAITTNGCTTLAAGASCPIAVTFSPTVEGPLATSLQIVAGGTTLTVTLDGTGIEAGGLTIAGTTNALGTVAVGQTSGTTADFTVTNTGAVPSGPLTVQPAGSDPADFKVSNDTCSGQTLSPAGSCTFTVSFAPQSPGAKSALIEVSGTPGGTVSGAVNGNALAPAHLVVVPGQLNFGSVVLAKTSGTLVATVANTGDVASGAIASSLSGTGAASFAITASDCTGVSLAPKGTCTVTLDFAPTTKGSEIALLTVTGAPGGSPTSSLFGTGIAASQITISPPAFDFTNTAVSQISASQTFTVTNGSNVSSGPISTALGGTDPAQFAFVGSADQCQGVTLAPGATCTMAVIFEPTHGGPSTAELTVTSQDAGTVTAGIQGLGVPAAQIVIGPAQRDFGGVVTGTASADQTFTVTNGGATPTGVPQTTITGANAGDFATSANGCTAAIAPGDTCTIHVHFQPTAVGSRAATLTVTGTPGGTATAALLGDGLDGTGLVVEPAAFTFAGITTLGDSSAAETFTVRNDGTVATGPIDVVPSGPNAGDFQVTNDCTTLAASATCTVTVTFKPTASGARTASFTATTGGSSARAALAGNAKPRLEVVALDDGPVTNPFDFGGAVINGTVAHDVRITVRNNTSADAAFSFTTVYGAIPQYSTVLNSCAATNTITAGGTCVVRVRFAPTSVGTKNGSITFAIGTGPSNQATQNLTGSGGDSLQITPVTSKSFGIVPSGEASSPQSFTVSNPAGSTTTGVLATTITAGPFAITSDGCAGKTLAGGASCVIEVTFTPVAGGFASADLNVSATPGGSPTITLDGTGAIQSITDKAPTALALSAETVFENQSAGILVGTLTTTDPDAGDTFVYTLVAGDIASFKIVGSQLQTNAVFDFETKSSYALTVRTTDHFGKFFEQPFTITVVDINDAPSFTASPASSLLTVLENAGAQSGTYATAISTGGDVSQNVTFVITNDSNASLFSAGPSVSSTGVLTYTPATDASGSATITLHAQDDGGTLNGGVDHSADFTFTITVNFVNHAPVFTKGGDQTVNEDSGLTTVTGWATGLSTGSAVTPESSQALHFEMTSDTNAALFSVEPAVAANGTLTFTPAANANGTATITIDLKDDGGVLNGGVDTSTSQTFVVTVNAVNDVPVFTKGADQTVLEAATTTAQSVSAWATAISTGPADESTQTLTFNVTGDTNAALFATAPAIDSAGNLTYTPAAHANGTATITVTLSDSGGTANGGANTSAAQTFVINVTSVNDVPVFTKGADVTVLEDSGASSGAWATGISAGSADESGQTLAFIVSGNTTPGLFSVAPAVSSTGVLTFTPAPNANGSSTITLNIHDNGGTANGGVDSSASQTFVINVTAVNDPPVFTKGADQTLLENTTAAGAAQTVNTWATAIAPGPATATDEAGQTLTFNVTNDNNGLFSVQPAISSTGVLTYTPAPHAFGTTVVSVTLSDNGTNGGADGDVNVSAAQTFTITVTGINDVPSFTKGADVTVLEDSGPSTTTTWATAISAGVGETIGGTAPAQSVNFVVTNDTNAGLFSVVPAVSSTGDLTFTPAANANGTATITLEIHDNGGTGNGGVDTSATQTFVINVTAVNDVPSFTKGADQSVNENAAAQTVSPWATALSAGPANESAQTLSFSITNDTNAALFSAGPAVSSTGVLTYTPAAGASGSATITLAVQDSGLTANGGVDTSATQTFTITVNHINHVPVFTAGATQTVLEDSGAQTVTGWATGISAGTGEGSLGQTVHFNIVSDDDTALFSAGPAIDSSGNLTFTPAANANGTANITVDIQDSGGTANGGVDTSATQSLVINVTAVNDVPSFTKGADQSVNENAAAQTVSPWATALSAGPANESAQTLSFSITNDTNAPLFSAGPAVSSTGVLTYTPAAGASGSATITLAVQDSGLTANGGVDTSATQTFTITVNHINHVPVFTAGATQTVLEDSGAQTVTGWATGISAGTGEGSLGQTVHFNIVSDDDTALFSAGPAIDSSGNLTFTPAANANGTANITVDIQDSGGTANGGVDTSATQSLVINVTAVNDVPSFTKGADQGNPTIVLDSAGAQTVNPWATALSTGPSDESSQTLTFAVTGDTHPEYFSTAPAISATGVSTYTPASGANGTAAITITLSDSGGTANGGQNTSASQTFDITITHVNQVPAFSIGGDLTVNEDASAQSPTEATAISDGVGDTGQTLTFHVSNDNNGLFSVQPSIDPTTGVLTYTPGANKNGSATVSVFLTDNGGTANGGVDTSGTKTFVINVTAVNDPPVAASKTLAAAEANMKVVGYAIDLAGDGSGDVSDADIGDASFTDSFTLNTPTVLDCGTSGTACAVNPTISNVSGAAGTFDFDPPPGFTGTIHLAYTVTDSGRPGTATSTAPSVSAGATSGLLSITVNGRTATTGVTNANVVWFVDSSASATGANGTQSHPFLTLAAAITAHANGDGIFVFSNSGASYAGVITLKNTVSLIGQGLSTGTFATALGVVVPALSSAPALGASHPKITTTATHSAVTLGTSDAIKGIDVDTTGGTTGYGITGSSFVALTVANVKISGNAGALNLDGNGATATLSGNFDSVDSTGGTTNVTFNRVSGVTAATFGTGTTFSGATTSAIRVTNCTNSSTFTFPQTITASTGAGDAIHLDTNTGATFNFGAGSMSLTTSSGTGFLATGGGTVNVTGTANTISSTAGTALNVANTTIGASGLTFQSITAGSASSGSGNGIVLDTTGSSGGLTVTGTGTTAGSGGTIQHKTGTDGNTTGGIGIYLNSTSSVSLKNMALHDFDNFAIFGNTVAGFSLANSVISSTGSGWNGSNAAGPYYEGSVSFTQLTGVASFTSDNISGGFSDNLSVTNSSGTLNRITLDTVTVGAMQSGAASDGSGDQGNDGVNIEAVASATINATINACTFTAARGDLFQFTNNNTSAVANDLIFTNNHLSNNYVRIATGGGGTTIGTNGAGNLTYSITGNTMRDAVGHALLLVKSTDLTTNGAASMIGTIDSNTIGVGGTEDSGSFGGDGIKLQTTGGLNGGSGNGGTFKATVTNNLITQYNNFGIDMATGGGASASKGIFEAILKGNTIGPLGDQTSAAQSQGIGMNGGNNVGDTFTMYLTVGGSGADKNTIHDDPLNAIADIRLRQRQSTTLNLTAANGAGTVSYGGAPTDTTAVAVFLASNNTLTNGSTNSASGSGGGFFGLAPP